METDLEEVMKTVTYYVAEDGKQFASKNDCMNHNIDLIDWTEFKGTYWVDVNIQKKVNPYGIKRTNYDVKLIPFEKLDVGVTLYSMLCEPDYYLSIPNVEVLNSFKKWQKYFYPIDSALISDLNYGLNRLDDSGDNKVIINLGCKIHEYHEDIREIESKLYELESLVDTVESNIIFQEHYDLKETDLC